MKLEDYGWGPDFGVHFEPHRRRGRDVGRVLRARRGWYRLVTGQGEVEARATGRLRHNARDEADLPAIGDWALLHRRPGDPTLRVEAVLPRRNQLSRKGPGTRLRHQVLAANVEQVFLVMGLDGDFNLRRTERFLAMAWESGARPLIVLNKVDLCPDWRPRWSAVESAAPGVEVLVVSCFRHTGLEELAGTLEPGTTTALVGSSGAGKSTLVNALCGRDVMRTGPVRAGDDRGRHTTSHRQLVLLPRGGLIIDNPGVREVHPWEAREALRDTFEDIHALARECQFRDCRHRGEPGCAVRRAVEEGVTTAERLAHFHALEEELQALATRRTRFQRRGRSAPQRQGEPDPGTELE